MNRYKHQEEYWNLGNNGVIMVKYRFTKEERKKNIGVSKSNNVVEENEDVFDLNKYSENTPGEAYRNSLTTNKDSNTNTELKLEEKEDKRKCQPPVYPKKNFSLFNRANPYNQSNENAKKTSSQKNILKVMLNNVKIDKSEEMPSENNKKKKLSTTYNNSNSLSNTNINHLTNLTTLDYEEINIAKYEAENNYAFYKDSFCEGFFIAGLPRQKAKVIVDSEHLLAPCRHKICNMLPAYKPDIIKRFIMGGQIEDNSQQEKTFSPLAISAKFDLTQAHTSLCFPHGIKVCYHKSEEEVRPMKNFMTVTTNEAGRHHYIYIFHYFQKISLIDFKNMHDFDPVTDYNRYNKSIQLILDKLSNDTSLTKKESAKYEEKHQEYFSMCCDLASRDYIYLPKCACLVSKLPYTKQMEKCLEIVIKMSIDDKISSEEISKFLLNLVYEIPTPPPNRRLLFYVPYQTHTVEITGNVVRDFPICGYNVKSLLEYFSPEVMTTIYYLILLESKILFVYDDYQKLTEITQAFLNLIYPMQWINTYIPVLSEEMIKYMKFFMPFMMGVDSNLLKYFTKTDDFDEENVVHLVFVNPGKKSTIDLSSDYKKGKRTKNIIKTLPAIPEEAFKDIIKEVDLFVNSLEGKKGDKHLQLDYEPSLTKMDSQMMSDAKAEKTLRKIFVKVMVMLLGDYKKYVSVIEDCHYFNSESYLSSRSENFKGFYDDLIQTGNFRQFLNSLKDSTYPFFDKMSTRYVNLVLSKSTITPGRRIFSNSKLLYSDSKVGKGVKRSLTRSNSISKNVSPEKERAPFALRKGSKNQSPMKSTNATQLTRTPTLKPSSLGFSLSHEANSDSCSVTNENTGKSYDQTESYLIMPYFLSHQMKSVVSVEDIIAEKFKYALDSQFLNKTMSSKIIPFEMQKEFKFDKMPTYLRNYIIPGYENNSYLANVKSSRLSNISLEENERKAHELSRDIINDFFKNIITSEYNTKIDNTILTNALTTKFGRSYFSRVLFQNKFRQNKSQILNEKGFEDLFHMIFNCLVISDNDKTQYDEVMRMTKSSFYFYK